MLIQFSHYYTTLHMLYTNLQCSDWKNAHKFKASFELNFLTHSLTTSNKKFQTLEDVQKSNSLKECGRLGHGGGRGVCARRGVECGPKPPINKVTSDSTTFRQFLQALSQQWDRQPFVSGSTFGAVTCNLNDPTWNLNEPSEKPSRSELTVEKIYQLHALEQPIITNQQYSNSPYWACHVPRWNWGTFHSTHTQRIE